MFLKILLISFLFNFYTYAIEKMTVLAKKSERKNRQTLEAVQKIHALDIEHLRKKNADVLSDALDNEPGIDTQVSCANCNSKRLTINGMRGEHTTILIDGIPLHSTVSSFYGMDAIPIIGVQSIEVMRGSGMALSAPESIGGAINIKTMDPFNQQGSFEVSGGTQDYQYIGAAGATNWQDGDQGLAVSAQSLERGLWDVDDNGMAEVPTDESEAIQAKYVIRKGDQQLSFRFGYQSLTINGGTTIGFRPTTYSTQEADERSFVGGDVRNRFVGNQESITDLINFDRQEYVLQYYNDITEDLALKGSVGVATQEQGSIYMHGYDYANFDTLNFNDIHGELYLGSDHYLKFGVDNRNHKMTSDSLRLYDVDGFARDNFNHQTFGLYLQDDWYFTQDFEILMAIRVDQITVDWTEYGQDDEVSETVIAPRLHMKYHLGNWWSTSFSYGLGYRSPLSLFESQHGSDHDGFIVDIDTVEQAHSLSFSLDKVANPVGLQLSSHYTAINNMAFGDESGEGPMLFTQYDETLSVWVNQASLLLDFNHFIHLQLTYENFRYQNAYAERLPIAAVEDRVTLESDFHFGQFESRVFLQWIGSRDLSRYGYDKHFNTFDGIALSNQKLQKAPSHYTVDWNVEYHPNDQLKLVAGVQNLFNYTQTGEGDSSTTWHQHDVNDRHLDNFHIWGPLLGRRWYLNAQYSF